MRSLLRIALAGLLLLSAAAVARPAGPEAPAEEVRSCHALHPAAPAWAAVCIGQQHYFRDTCRAIQFFAWRHGLPSGYFARLIWQESRFDPHAVSVAGAEGIAQFIPSTARLRGLSNSFDPAEALAKSADYLQFLVGKYGNLGLAAAAYNAGEGRLTRYAAAGGYLPWETRSYVETITGLAVDAWLADEPPEVDLALGNDADFVTTCVRMAERESVPQLDRPPSQWQPWGVMLAQDFSQAITIRRFERVQKAYPKLLGSEQLMLLQARNPNFGPRLRYIAMIGRQTREAADDLCQRLQSAGGACIVRKN